MRRQRPRASREPDAFCGGGGVPWHHFVAINVHDEWDACMRSRVYFPGVFRTADGQRAGDCLCRHARQVRAV